MNLKKILLSLVLIDFIAFTGWVIFQLGFVGAFEAALSTPAGWQVFFDLLIAAGVGMWWTWRDARARGVNPLPWMALTLCTGSPGVLLYLLARPDDA